MMEPIHCDYCGFYSNHLKQYNALEFKGRAAMICDECVNLLKSKLSDRKIDRQKMCVGDIKLANREGGRMSPEAGSIDWPCVSRREEPPVFSEIVKQLKMF